MTVFALGAKLLKLVQVVVSPLQGSAMFNLFLFYICSIVHVHVRLVCDAGMEHNIEMLHKENESCCVAGLDLLFFFE